MQEPPCDIRRRFIIGMAFEPGVAHLVDDSHPLHRPSDEQHFARRWNDKDVRREVSPVIEPCEIENVLRRRDEEGFEPLRMHASSRR